MIFEAYKAILGMIGSDVKDVKMIGRRAMNMDPYMKDFLDEVDVDDRYFTKPYFNDAQDNFQK